MDLIAKMRGGSYRRNLAVFIVTFAIAISYGRDANGVSRWVDPPQCSGKNSDQHRGEQRKKPIILVNYDEPARKMQLTADDKFDVEGRNLVKFVIGAVGFACVYAAFKRFRRVDPKRGKKYERRD